MIKKFCLFWVKCFFLLFVVFCLLWKFSPSFAEKVLLAGLVVPVRCVNKMCAYELRNYPSRSAAVGLSVFVVAKYPRSEEEIDRFKREAEQKEEVLSEEVLRRVKEEAVKEAQENEPLAEEALISLCFLTGHDFGSYFKKEKYGYSWGGLSEKKWAEVARNVSNWGAITFGKVSLSPVNEPVSLDQGLDTFHFEVVRNEG